jgi:hypothetical protein
MIKALAKKQPRVYLDFEYTDSKEEKLRIVCCVLYVHDENNKFVDKEVYWLFDGDYERLVDDLEVFRKQNYLFIAYNVIAEARSVLSIDMEVTDIHWIDLWLEYRNLLNHNHKLMYGKQLIKGKKRVTKPKASFYDNDSEDNSKPEDGYAAACYKLLGIEIDTDRKKLMRDIIIRGNAKEINANKQEILDYCEDDVVNLPKMLTKIMALYKRKYTKADQKKIKQWMLNRGNYSARTAIMEELGYPVNYKYMRNFADNVPTILGKIQGEINELNNEKGWIREANPFEYNLRTGLFKWNQRETREWIKTLQPDIANNWDKTKPSSKHPNGQYSLSLESFQKYFHDRHSYSQENLGSQIVRYLKTKQHLNGFSPSSKSTIWDALGSDKRVRPYFNIYGSQSSRSQPSSTSFLFLKSAWMRSLCETSRGRAMGGIDWKSQEVLIAGLLADDSNLLRAYHSGDVYLWFAKEVGAVPRDGTKETHGHIRNRFKATVLGIMYLMGAKSLAHKITGDTGEETTEEEAQDLIDQFDDLFWSYADFKEEFFQYYKDKGYFTLQDGWTMWGDNPNHRSIKNCPVQGSGADIMRRAVTYAQDMGLDVPFTLHDALYIEFESDDLAAMDDLNYCMVESFQDYFPKYSREEKMVGTDANIWSPDYPEDKQYVKTPNGLIVKQERIYVDERAGDEYQKFSKYFKRDEVLDLL